MAGPDIRNDTEKGGSNDRDPITRLATSIVEIFSDADERAVQVHLDTAHPEMSALLDELYSYGMFAGSEAILSTPMVFRYNKADPGITENDLKMSVINPTLPPKPASVGLVVSAGSQPAMCFRLVSLQRIEPTSQLVFVQMLGVSMTREVGPIVFRTIECKRVYGVGEGSVTELIAEGDFREVTTPERAEVICDLIKEAIQRMADI